MMKTNILLAALAVILGITAAFTNHSEKTGLYPTWKYETERIQGEKVHFISASHLADLIYGKEQEIRILDIQGEEAFQKYHIPSSLRYNGEDPLPGNETSAMIILCGRAEDPEVYQIAGQFNGKVFVVKGGIEQWYDLVLFPDFLKMQVRNSERLREMHYRSYYFGGTPRNNQLLNISVRENRFREGC